MAPDKRVLAFRAAAIEYNEALLEDEKMSMLAMAGGFKKVAEHFFQRCQP